MDTVGDIMIKEVVTVKSNLTIFQVVKVIGDNKVGSVVVVNDENIPIGMVTEKDIVRKGLYKNVDLNKEKITTIMATPVITVTPDVNIFFASKLMQERDFRRLPITINKKLVGIVTESMITKHFTEQRRQFYKKINPELAKMY